MIADLPLGEWDAIALKAFQTCSNLKIFRRWFVPNQDLFLPAVCWTWPATSLLPLLPCSLAQARWLVTGWTLGQESFNGDPAGPDIENNQQNLYNNNQRQQQQQQQQQQHPHRRRQRRRPPPPPQQQQHNINLWECLAGMKVHVRHTDTCRFWSCFQLPSKFRMLGSEQPQPQLVMFHDHRRSTWERLPPWIHTGQGITTDQDNTRRKAHRSKQHPRLGRGSLQLHNCTTARVLALPYFASWVSLRNSFRAGSQ